MTLAQLAEFWRAQGKRVVPVDDLLLFTDSFRSVFFSYPLDRVVRRSNTEVAGLLRRERGLLARVTRPPGAGHCDSALYLCEDRTYDLPKLAKHRRNVVRKGLKEAEYIGAVTPEIVARDGYALEVESLRRQGRAPNIPPRPAWKRYVQPWLTTPDACCWGALQGGRLVGLMLVVHVEDTLEIHCHRSGGIAVKTGINNAMVFELVRRAFASGDVRRVSYGLMSVHEVASLGWFKQTMGFQPIQVRHEFVVHPWLRPLLPRFLLRAASWGLRRSSRRDDLLKVAATLSLLAGDPAAPCPPAGAAADSRAGSCA